MFSIKNCLNSASFHVILQSEVVLVSHSFKLTSLSASLTLLRLFLGCWPLFAAASDSGRLDGLYASSSRTNNNTKRDKLERLIRFEFRFKKEQEILSESKLSFFFFPLLNQLILEVTHLEYQSPAQLESSAFVFSSLYRLELKKDRTQNTEAGKTLFVSVCAIK